MTELGFVDGWRWVSAMEVATGLRGELAEARALISWIDGQCVDCADHMTIREAINRYYKEQHT